VYNQYGDIGIKLYRLRSVQRGPFQGMKFRSLNTKKSTLFPKLIGCYEECLHEPIYDLIDNHYSKIIDIGCAEGYYAIGLARMFKDARVSGYDLDSDAIRQAQQNARINGLSDRVELTAERYTQEMLLAEDFTGPALIMCDAQGDEMNLFTAETVSRLKNVDLIIEMHNFVDPRIKTTLLQLFSPTHCSKMVEQMSTSPVVSSFFQSSPETNKLFKLMDEGRPEKMEWLILKRRRSNPETL
jgi:precorrin-6B methylase 2